MTPETAAASRNAARFLAIGLLAAGLICAPFQPSRADDKPDPVVAKVGTDVIHLSDVTAVANSLPPHARQMPPDQLLPKVLDQMVDTQVLAVEARKQGLDKDPAVERTLHEVMERALVSAFLEKKVGPQITDRSEERRV